MLGLILTIVVLALGLGVLLWVGTVWFQGYIYSEPVSEIYWRAPAASAAIALYLGLWAFLEYRNPERFETFFNFSPREEKDFNEIWAVRAGQKTRYTRGRDAKGITVYRDAEGRPPMTHPDAVVVKEDDQEVEFRAERDDKGHFKIERGRSLRYTDDRGREMTEDHLGRLSTFRWSLLWLNLFVNLLHLGVWFACLWLLLRFQWPHALGLAIIFWLTVTLAVMPMVLAKARDAAKQRSLATSPAVAARVSLPGCA